MVKYIVLNKNGVVAIYDDEGRELERYNTVIGAVISRWKTVARLRKGQSFVKWDPYNVPILSEQSGVIEFHDFIEGVTMK